MERSGVELCGDFEMTGSAVEACSGVILRWRGQASSSELGRGVVSCPWGVVEKRSDAVCCVVEW